MAIAYFVSALARRCGADAGAGRVRVRPCGLRLPWHGSVTIAVTATAPSPTTRSRFTSCPRSKRPRYQGEIKKDFGFKPDFENAKVPARGERRRGQHFQGDRQARAHRHRGRRRHHDDFRHHRLADEGSDARTSTSCRCSTPPFLLGLIMGGAVIYWFTGASMQAVTTGAYRAVEFIKENMKLEGVDEGLGGGLEESRRDLHPVRAEGHVQHLPRVFFFTLALPFFEPYFFIGYLISIALFGLFQAIFMANAGGAWDNAKKVVEAELQAERHRPSRGHRRRRHRRRPVQGHLVGRAEPGHQVHDALRLARRRVACGRPPKGVQCAMCSRRPSSWPCLRVSLVLRDAHRRGISSNRAGVTEARCRRTVCDPRRSQRNRQIYAR